MPRFTGFVCLLIIATYARGQSPAVSDPVAVSLATNLEKIHLSLRRSSQTEISKEAEQDVQQSLATQDDAVMRHV